MRPPSDIASISGMDIYLIDQILKGRYLPGQHVLDAGVGSGRNLHWFLDNDFHLTSCDRDPMSAEELRSRYPERTIDHHIADLAALPFDSDSFDAIICNAVLHFADNEQHFRAIWKELLRVCRPGGSVFIRTCSNVGLENAVERLPGGRHRLPDGSERFLLDRSLFRALIADSVVELLEPVKWVNVSDQRVMMTVVLRKDGASH